MPGWKPEALVSRQVATHATVSDVTSTSDAWRSAAAKHEQKRWAEQSEKALQNDAGFKRHQANVERALSRFESVGEWADFISFLARLLKTLQAQPKFNAIPHKLTVAKRLSQCLNPALPSGVHTRALEVYAHIFSVIGVDGLRRDLSVWTPGLLPFFQNAATSVRPALLDLYDRYYLPLGADLRPLTRALLLSLLPGLEEESGEFFDRVVGLLDHVATSVQRAFFLQTMWLVLISSQSVRLSTLHYLARRMPPLQGEHDEAKDEPSEAIALRSLRPDLLARGFSHTLSDDSLLVRRNALDFLVAHLPLASDAWASLSAQDSVLLLDAGIGAVLRRDISLNRRLYAWLLGKGDTDEAQQAYFVKHGLPFVTTALRTAMRSSAADVATLQRPYKILISLMDKSTIGQPLLREIILDALSSLVQTPKLAEHADLYPTAQTLFEAMDPFVLYQQLYVALADEVKGTSNSVRDRCGSVVTLFQQILDVFVLHDEEAVATHIPLLYLALIRWVEQGVPAHLSATLAAEVLILVEKLQSKLDTRMFMQHGPPTMQPLGAGAAAFYIDSRPFESVPTLQDQGQCTQLVQALFHIGLVLAPATSWSKKEQEAVSTRCFALLVGTLEHVQAAHATEELDSSSASCLGPEWDASAWDAPAFAYLADPPTFEAYAHLLRAVLCATTSKAVPGTFALDTYSHAEQVLLPLLNYLQPRAFALHAQATELYWSLEKTVAHGFVTTIVCTRLSDPATRADTLGAFGALWRLGDAAGVAQTQLGAPLFLVLDQLRSSDIQEQQQGQLWLHMYLGSYTTLVRLLLGRLLDVAAVRTSYSVSTPGRRIQAYVYTEPFDQDMLNYYLATLDAVLRVGGATLLGAMRETLWANGTALEAATAHLFLLLRSAPRAGDWPNDGNATTHALALAIVQQALAVEKPEDAWSADVQAQLLDVVEIAMRRRDPIQRTVLLVLLDVLRARFTTLDDETSLTFRDLLQQGLLHAPIDTVFFGWTDFCHSLLPLARDAVNELLLPLCATISGLLAASLDRLALEADSKAAWRTAFLAPAKPATDQVPGTEREMVQMISVMEHALLQAMSSRQLIEKERLRDLELYTSAGFLGNISSVFVGETSAPSTANVSPVLRSTALVVQHLEHAWFMSTHSRLALAEVHARSIGSLERLYRMHTASAVESILEKWWNRTYHGSDDERTRLVNAGTVALLEELTASPQVLVSSLSDAILSRTSPGHERRKAVGRALVGEWVLFRFLEMYMAELPAEAVGQVWPLIVLLAKNIANNHATNKALVYSTLRLVVTTGRPLSKSHAFEERKTRRELQDTLVRLCEQVISLYARTLDISAVKRNAKDSDATSDMDAPEEPSAGAGEAATAPPPATIVAYFSSSVLPALLPFSVEGDKVVALCTSLVYYVLTPGFRSRSRSVDVEPSVLDLLGNMARIPNTIKTWRGLVVDTVMDSKFFTLSPAAGKQWAPIIAALYANDRDKLADVIGRIATTPTNNLFTSRETDLIARIVGIRRLSYSLYAGERNAALAQLPMIQEKVVDILRSQAPELVQAEVYLCMRVLLCRFASQHLTGFWPIILTELLRLFGKAKSELPADNTDGIQLLFSAAKLTDYLLTLQTDDFQIHQWLFITDTPDAIDPPREWIVESLLDSIGKLAAGSQGDAQAYVRPESELRRPMLQMSRANTIAALEPFFLHVSEAFYDNECTSTMLDWQNIDADLLRDLFEPPVVRP